mgnify:CR=1 FL=1
MLTAMAKRAAIGVPGAAPEGKGGPAGTPDRGAGDASDPHRPAAPDRGPADVDDPDDPSRRPEEPPPYRLDAQIGFLLRLATQRHTAIFAAMMPGDLTPMQFSALARLLEVGATSQNELGRLTAMDAATIKGVVARLRAGGLVACARDPADRRRITVDLTPVGRALVDEAVVAGRRITAETAAPLSPEENATLCRLLARIG